MLWCFLVFFIIFVWWAVGLIGLELVRFCYFGVLGVGQLIGLGWDKLVVCSIVYWFDYFMFTWNLGCFTLIFLAFRCPYFIVLFFCFLLDLCFDSVYIDFESTIPVQSLAPLDLQRILLFWFGSFDWFFVNVMF